MLLYKRLLRAFGEVKIQEDYKGYIFFRYVLNKKPKMQMACHILGNKIHIEDIMPCQGSNRNKCVNRGYGSELMAALIEYATENGISEIYGELSMVDFDHQDRLHHFYEKFGFKITVFPILQDSYYGCISKIL